MTVADRIFQRDGSVLRQRLERDTIARVVRFAAPYSGMIAWFLAVVVSDAAIGVVNPLLYKNLINHGILSGNVQLVVSLALLAGLLHIFDAGLGVAQTWLAAKIGSQIILAMRTDLFDHIQQMSLAFFARAQTGALVSRINSDVAGAQSAFTDVLSSVIGDVITATLLLTAMLFLSWRITLVALLLIPIFVVPAKVLGRRLQAVTRESYDLSAGMNNTMVERFNVAGAQLSKLYGRREEENAIFKAQAARVAEVSVERVLFSRVFFAALALLGSLASAIAFGWGGVMTVRHQMDLGSLVALVSYLTRLYVPITGLSNMHVTVMTALVSFERVFEVLDLPPTIHEKAGANPLPEGPSKIVFEHVSFRYPIANEVSLASLESIAIRDKAPESIVLHDISFTAAPGTVTALVGPSGAGKTTIALLVPRLYDPQHGSIRIDGEDVRDVTLKSLYRRVGIVTQDAHLFHDTIRYNLQYARPEATDSEIETVLRAAQLWNLVAGLPKGLDTIVGERGYRFSGGEKQRLSIARMLLKAPDIVILDEATAHLDSESEAAVQKALKVALRGRTSLVIAHRLSTILQADQILVIQDGNIAQRGTHDELMSQEGIYSDLYRRQFSRFEA